MAPVPVTVAFHGDDGSALSLPATITQQGVTQTSAAASVNAVINPNATLLISVGDQIIQPIHGINEAFEHFALFSGRCLLKIRLGGFDLGTKPLFDCLPVRWRRRGGTRMAHSSYHLEFKRKEP